MPVILLVRHAQASFGGPDYDVLSENGERQAAALDSALAGRGLGRVTAVSGPARRQRDTAALCSKTLGGARVTVDPRWDEYDTAGLIGRYSDEALSLTDAGTTSEQFQERIDPVIERWTGSDKTGPGSWADFRQTVASALDSAGGSLERGQTGLVFSSAGTIAAAVCVLLDLPPAVFVPLNRIQVNTGITKVVVGRRGASLITFNEHGHLEHDRELVTYR